jgi:hypothetical protein
LSAAYYPHLQPERLVAYAKLRVPGFARDSKTLKAWCEARRQNELYELQIEACEWAIEEVAKADAVQGVPGATRHQWAASIRAEVASLRKSRAAVRFAGFAAEERTPYHPHGQGSVGPIDVPPK